MNQVSAPDGAVVISQGRQPLEKAIDTRHAPRSRIGLEKTDLSALLEPVVSGKWPSTTNEGDLVT